MKRGWSSQQEMMDFFGENKPVTVEEFTDFWCTLNASEQIYFMAAPLEVQPENKFSKIAEYFGCTIHELYVFWHGLSEAEQNQFIHAGLS